MKKKNDFQLVKCFIFAIGILIVAKFIFSDGMSIISNAFKPFIIACIFIYLFGPFADYLHRKTRLNRSGSVIVSYITLFLLFTLFILMIVPAIGDSISLLISNIRNYNEAEIINFVNRIPIVSDYINISTLSEFLRDVEDFIVNYSSSILKYSTDIINSIGSAIYLIIIIIFALLMAFYALKDNEHIGRNLQDVVYSFFPEKFAYKLIRIVKLTDSAIKKYLVSKLYTCLILGVLVALTILIVNWVSPFHIPYAPLMGFLIGLSNLIPYVGFIIGVVPCIVIALFSGFWEAVILSIIVFVWQQVDNLIVSPKIIGDTVGVKPFWVIVSITVGGSLFGPIGMIISVPIVSVILHLIDERVVAYRKKQQKQKKDNADEPKEVL